jgi:DNA polymerase IV
MGPAFVENLPVAKFYGVGPATTAKMHWLGIEIDLDLRAQTLPFRQRHFGKSGAYYYRISRGVDERPVHAGHVRKSVGAENTFAQDLHAFEPISEALEPIIAKIWRHCQATGIRGRTLTLKVKFADFEQITRSQSVDNAIDSLADLEGLSLGLLEPLLPTRKGVRLPGVSLSSLISTALLMIVTLPTAIFLTLIFLASNQQKDIFPSEEQKRPNSDRGTRALCGVPGTFPDRRGFDSIEEAVNDARQDRA